MCKSVSGPIFGLCSEHLSVVLRGIGFIRFQSRRNATTSTIAEANIVITRSFFVGSRQQSTTYRLKRSSSVWSQQCRIAGKRICSQTNAEPRCLTSLDGHDGAICAAKHLELVHARHLANPYTDLTNSIWGKKY